MKAWITKYALTRGVIEVDGEVSKSSSELFVYSDGKIRLTAFREGREWHRTEDGAKERAKVMRRAKITSLCNQIDKLEAMEF